MSELFQSKKFLSAIVGTIFIIIVNFMFIDTPETAQELQYMILGLFGIQIGMQGYADKDKEKLKSENKKIELENKRSTLELKIAEAAARITMSKVDTPNAKVEKIVNKENW